MLRKYIFCLHDYSCILCAIHKQPFNIFFLFSTGIHQKTPRIWYPK